MTDLQLRGIGPGRINIPEGQSGTYAVRHQHHPEGGCWDTANARQRIFGGQRGVKLQFDQPLHWHQLLGGVDASVPDSGRVLMSDIPAEQAQMTDCSEGLSGDVLVGGLGLGLAATILAEKEEVDTVTVVEISDDVISLVEPHVASDKIRVIPADLLAYLGISGKGSYDSALYDIWSGDGEAEFFQTVVPLREASVGVVRGRINCWNEDVMRGQLQMGLPSRLAAVTWNEGWEGADTMLSPASGLDLETARTRTGQWYADWSVPFFDFVTEETAEQLLALAPWYVANIGMPGFKERWRELAGTEVDR